MEEENAPVWSYEDVRHLLPPSGWICDHVRYAIECTDAPPLYHGLAAAAAISGAISPWLELNVWGRVHPLHLFILLLGNSGSRKTTAFKIVRRIIDPAFQDATTGGESRLVQSSTGSPEGLLDALSVLPHRLMFFDEWTNFHDQLQLKYWAAANDLPNLLYDGEDLNRSLSRGRRIQVKAPRVTIVGASTPEHIHTSVTRKHWLSGLLARYIMFRYNRPAGKVMISERDQSGAREELQARFREFVGPTSTTQAVLSGAAWTLYKDWSLRHLNDFTARAPERLQPTLARMQEHVLRLAAVYEASMIYPSPVVVTDENMQRAIWLVEAGMETIIEEFRSLPDPDAEKSPIHRVRMLLRGAGGEGVTRRDLIRRLNLNLRGINDVVETLKQSEEISEAFDRGGRGRPSIRYFYKAETD